MKILFKIALVCLGFAVISPAKAADFDIVINYVPGSNFTPSQKAAFAQAEATWESLITSYKPNSVTAGTTLVIDADNPPIDGVNGILGSAGPTSGILAGSYLFATAGSMSFDSADVAALESNGTWAAVILHEMGHVIGIGTLWSSAGVGAPGYQELYVDGTGQYTGATGLAAYQQEFVGQQSAAFVPVELGGGGGTANGHWNEGDGGGTTGIKRVSDGKDMNLMLMSGWLNGGSFISDTTLGSFEDLGYNTTLDLNPQDTTPPTADLSSPADGDSIAPSVINAQGYIEVTFADSGDGVDASSINGGELSLSGSGVGSATLSGGAPTLVSGTTYRYAFTGSFAVGSVDVEFVVGSFADLAETPNTNATETEGFTVSEIGEISGTVWEDNNSDGVIDTGEALLENWTVFLDNNQNGQLDGGEQSALTNANGAYTFSGLAAGSYMVTIVTQEGFTQTSPVQALVDPSATADPLSFNIDKHSQVSLADFNAVAAAGGFGSSSVGNDIVAYVAPDGGEYAIIGLERTIAFVRVTDPANPMILSVLPGADEGGEPGDGGHLHLMASASGGEHPVKEGSNWRDMAVYDEYAYVVNENSGGIQVFDLRHIGHHDDPEHTGGHSHGHVDILSTPGQFGPSKSHNVTINPDSGYLYLSGSNAGGLQVYDLNADPTSPTFAGSSPVSYIHDLIVHSYTSGPYAGKEIVFAFSGGSGVRIIDVTDKNNMVVMSTTSYPNKTYTHHGALSEDLQYLFVNDELDEPNNANVSTTTTYILDIQNLSAPSYVTSFTNGLAAIDHNPMVIGNYLYEANYTSGLRVYDISDINNVTEVGHYDTYPANNATTFHGAWGLDASLPSGNVILSDIQGGLYVLDPSRVSATNGSYLVELGDLETVTGVDFGVENLAAPPDGSFLIDFGTASSPVASGYTRVTAAEVSGTKGDLDRSSSGYNDLLRDVVFGSDMTYTLTGLPAGTYDVTLYIGEPESSKSTRDDDVYLQGVLVDNGLVSPGGTVQSRSYAGISVDAGGTLTLRVDGSAGSASANALVAGMDVVAAGPPLETLTVAIVDESISENGGSTTATVSRSGDTTNELVVDLTSDDTGEASVPATVTITAGQTISPAFVITGVDDALSDGAQTVSITASVAAGGYTDGSDTLELTDDEPAPSGYFIDFGTASSPVASGYTRVTAAEVSGTKGDLDRSSSGYSDLLRDVVFGSDMTYTLTGLPAGTYDVTLYIGEPESSKSTRDDDVYLQGVLVDNGLVSPGGTVQSRSYAGISVDAGGTLTLRVDGSAGSASANALVAGMDVVAAGPPLETLTVAIVDESISENGGSTTATVSRSGDTTNELVVDLTSDDTGEASVPATVTITAGQTISPAFVITGVDDALSDGAQTVSITASVAAGGYTDGSDTLELTDDEPAPSGYFIDFGTASSPVASGYTRVTAAEVSGTKGDLDRSSSGYSDLLRDVVFGSDMTYTLTGLPAGTYDVTLYIGEPESSKSTRDDDVYLQGVLVDNGLVSPGGTVQSRSYAGISVDAGGTLTLRVDGSAGSASANALVAGMDVVAAGPPLETLTVAIVDESISENGGSTTATVSRSGDTTNELVVDLTSDDTGEASVPATVTITAGQTISPAFVITGVDDALSDGAQTVSITASVAAGGYTDGSDTLELTDDEPAPSGYFIDFGTASSPVASGYTRVTAAEVSGTKGDLDRSSSGYSDLLRDVVFGSDMTYTLTGLPAGTYDVTLYIGEPESSKSTRDDDVYLQGVLVDNGLVSPGGTVQSRSYAGISVDAGGTLTLRVVGLGGVNNNALVAGMDVVASGAALTAAEFSSESSLTESSAITSNNSYQLASGGLVGGGLDDTSTTDSDGDGVADDKDLFPNDADFARVSDYVNFIIDYLVDDRVIFDEDWKELQNEADFIAELEALLELVLAAEQAQDAEWAALLYMEALGIVDDELLIRTDGFHGGSFEDDWIAVEEAQDILHADLNSLREYLWLIAP